MALPTAWIPGVNAPAFGRGKFHVLNEAGHQIVGNMLTHKDRAPAEVFINLHSALVGRRSHCQAQRDCVIALLCGVSRGTVRNWRAKLQTHGPRFSTLSRSVVPDSCRPEACHVASVIDDLPQVDTIELPEISDCDTSGSESADGDFGGSANGDRSRDTLQKWRSHPNFVMVSRTLAWAT